MLGKTHARLAREVAKKCDLKEHEAKLLELGSTRPDSFEEFPHHQGREGLILEKILDARALYLEGDDEAFVRLGEALHYIADKWTLRPRMWDKHTEWEAKIDKCKIMTDVYFKKELMDAAIPTKTRDFYLTVLKAVSELFQITRQGIEYRTDYESDRVPLISKLSEFPPEDWIAENPETAERIEITVPWADRDKLDEIVQETWDRQPKNVYKRIFKTFIFPIPQVFWLSRRDEYSSPQIDLNLAFRFCFVVTCFVIAGKGEITLASNPLLDWDRVPIDWRAKAHKWWSRETGEEIFPLSDAPIKSERLEEKKKSKPAKEEGDEEDEDEEEEEGMEHYADEGEGEDFYG